MPYDWRREQEQANQRRARDAQIAAQQAAHNRKLQENSKKGMDFWTNKMGKELEEENRRVVEQKRLQSSSGWGPAAPASDPCLLSPSPTQHLSDQKRASSRVFWISRSELRNQFHRSNG
jgi:hypothetical protein